MVGWITLRAYYRCPACAQGPARSIRRSVGRASHSPGCGAPPATSGRCCRSPRRPHAGDARGSRVGEHRPDRDRAIVARREAELAHDGDRLARRAAAGRRPAPARLYVAMDGVRILAPRRGKEVKVGLVAPGAPQPRRELTPAAASYVAGFEPAEAFAAASQCRPIAAAEGGRGRRARRRRPVDLNLAAEHCPRRPASCTGTTPASDLGVAALLRWPDARCRAPADPAARCVPSSRLRRSLPPRSVAHSIYFTNHQPCLRRYRSPTSSAFMLATSTPNHRSSPPPHLCAPASHQSPTLPLPTLLPPARSMRPTGPRARRRPARGRRPGSGPSPGAGGGARRAPARPPC